MIINGLGNQFIDMNHSIFIDDKMDMLQIPSTFTDLVGWFDLLNIEFKVLIAIIAILLCMVLIFIVFKLIEVFFLLLRVILDGFLKIFRKSSKIVNKIIISNQKSEASEEIDSSNQEKNEEYEETNLIDADKEGKEQVTSKEGASITKNMDPRIKPDFKELNHENSTLMIHCPNCGNNFSQNSYSKIGDTHFVSCEECGKRYISDGEQFLEK